MSITTRPMNESDVEPVARLRMEAFFADTDRSLEEDMADLRALIGNGDPKEASLVARLAGTLAGSILLVRHELDARHDLSPWLAGLVVAPDARRQGVGTVLVRALEDHARLCGVERLYLYTWEARRFYALLGWRAVETFEDGDGPMMLMARRLL